MELATTIFNPLLAEAKKSFHGNDKREAWLDSLPNKNRAAIVFFDLFYQVQNGGFPQWECNGMGIDVKFLKGYLPDICTFAADKCLEIIEDYEDLAAEQKRINQLLSWGELPEDEEEEVSYRELDKAFYQIDEALIADVVKWLENLD